MKTIASCLPIIFTLSLALPACTADTAEAPEATGSASSALLFDMTEAQLAKLLPLASGAPTLDSWIALHRRAFDCASYGDMCRAVGPEAAYSINKKAYELGLEGETREAVNAFIGAEVAAASSVWSAAHEAEERADARCSSTVSDTGSANNERVRTTVETIKPGVGDPYTFTECVYQKRTLGVWGGNASAFLKATWSGHLHDSAGNQYDNVSPVSTATLFRHRLVTANAMFPNLAFSTDDAHGFGTCEASLNGWSATASTNCIEN